jgi:hypothetical protein
VGAGQAGKVARESVWTSGHRVEIAHGLLKGEKLLSYVIHSLATSVSPTFARVKAHEPKWNNLLKLSHAVTPEILEPHWRQLSVAHGVLDVFVPQVVLD